MLMQFCLFLFCLFVVVVLFFLGGGVGGVITSVYIHVHVPVYKYNAYDSWYRERCYYF